jgi:DNA-binding CsgD family transcriptional regulator
MSGAGSPAHRASVRLLPRAIEGVDEPRVSRREVEVLQLIAEGQSTREIARRLWITEETVKTHVRRLLDKLGARTRAQAVAVAFRRGVLR